jgi:AcrR family transcriptional regulator
MSVAQRKLETGRTHAERRREAESRIVHAAFEIVARRGVDQLTLAEAGEEAGYSRALPAHYFASREALLAAVAEHAVELYRQRLTERNVAKAAGREAILEAIAFHIDDSRTWPKRLRAFHEIVNAGLRWPSIAEVVARLNHDSVARLAAQIEAAQTHGEIAGHIDPQADAVMVTGALRGIMSQWLLAPDSIDLDRARDALTGGLRRSWTAAK